jgi:hypothetical protein
MDPRVTTPPAGLQQQFTLSRQAYDGIFTASNLSDGAKKLADKLRAAREKAPKDAPVAKDIDALLAKLNLVTNGPPAAARGNPVQLADFPLGRLAAAFTSLLELMQEPDAAPTTQAVAAAGNLSAALEKSRQALLAIDTTDVPALNAKLRAANLPMVSD